MPHLLLKDLPRYECLLEAASQFPKLDPSACEAFLHLLRTSDEVFACTERNLTEHGISHGRFGVMMQLWGCCDDADFAGLTPAELADRTGVTRATMTGLVDTLERDGFVRRVADTADRRMMRVCLTPLGHKFLEDMLPGHFERMAAVMAPLTEAERKALVALLNKVLQHTSQLNTPAAAPDPDRITA